MKIGELKAGAVLSGLTAIAQGYGIEIWGERPLDFTKTALVTLGVNGIGYEPSDSNPAQAFELIEKFKLRVLFNYYEDNWEANYDYSGDWYHYEYGSTPAEAICKAVCASVWGDTVPDEIMARVA